MPEISAGDTAWVLTSAALMRIQAVSPELISAMGLGLLRVE